MRTGRRWLTKSTPIYVLLLLLLYLLRLPLTLLPRRLRLSVPAFLAFFVYLLDRPDRRVAYRNLSFALGLPAPRRRKVLRTSILMQAWHLADAFFTPPLDRRRLRRLLPDRPYAALEEALSEGRGAVVVTAHFGAEALLCYVVGALHRSCCIARPQRVFQALMERHRARRNVKTVLDRRTSYAELLRWLADGRVVLLTLDQALRRKGVWVRFLDRPAHTPYFAADLARLSGAPLFVAFMFHRRGRYRFLLRGPIRIPRTADERESRFEYTQLINDILGGVVRRWPEYWFWTHRRWRTDIGIDRYPEATAEAFASLPDPYAGLPPPRSALRHGRRRARGGAPA